MRYFVKIVAQDIQVTASSPEEAERAAEEDAREFYAQWNYMVDEVRPARAGEALTTADDDDFVLEVEAVGDDAEGDDAEATYTFDATFALVVEAETPEQAGDIAKFYYKIEKYGPQTHDPEIGAQAIKEILAYGAKGGADFLAAVSQLELDGSDAEGMVSLAYQAITDIPSTDPAHDTLERIMEFRKRNGGYDGSDAKGILAIAVKFQAPEPVATPTP